MNHVEQSKKLYFWAFKSIFVFATNNFNRDWAFISKLHSYISNAIKLLQCNVRQINILYYFIQLNEIHITKYLTKQKQKQKQINKKKTLKSILLQCQMLFTEVSCNIYINFSSNKVTIL